MKIVFLGLEYFNAERPAPGFEDQFKEAQYKHVYIPLTRFGEVIFYPLEQLNIKSRDEVREDLLNIYRNNTPDILIFWISHLFDPEIMREITQATKIPTVGIFTDDEAGYWVAWRAFAGGVFDWSLVAYPPAVPWHLKTGDNVIGFNVFVDPETYHPLDGVRRDIDVSFVGSAGRHRKKIIEKLEHSGIKVKCFGKGWPHGPLGHKEMISIFNRSKINLNLEGRPLLSFWNPRELASALIHRVHSKNGTPKISWDFRNFIPHLRGLYNLAYRPATKGRLYEVAATRSFLLTYPARYFGEPFAEGKEIIHYRGFKDLVSKIQYYLAHDREREQIAAAAYQRFSKDYTASVVLKKIFDVIFDGDPKRRLGTVRVIE